MAAVVRDGAEREPICGICWAERHIVPLEYLLDADRWMCPRCGAVVDVLPDEDDEQDQYRSEDWNRGVPGQPPWRQGLHQTRAQLPRKGGKTGRRRRRERKWKPWYQRGGAV